ncbi:DUF7674 family protein [Leifsonia sp. 2MCAF36]|uniref:DUF7674 family protein n=1 Tax=Leifsonia sp. 2MCAF36 TaxID=3232988 RepID=UPI003F9BBEFC
MSEWMLGVATAVPSLLPLVNENLADFNGDLQAHLLFGEFTEWAEHEYERDPQSPTLRTFLDTLELGLSLDDPYIDNVISVSFIENLGWESPMFTLLGPRTLGVAKGMFPPAIQKLGEA